MQIKKGTGNITALEIPDALATYNDENGVTRARLLFSFVGSNSADADDLTSALLNRVGNNSYSLIIDISDIGLQKAIALFVGKTAQFTVFSFSIEELTGGKYTLVNNGEREYSSLSSPHVGEADEKAGFDSLVKRLKKDISEGNLFLGELPQSNTPPQKQGGQRSSKKSSTPPAQGGQRSSKKNNTPPPPAQDDEEEPF